jgi:hypothetical protein
MNYFGNYADWIDKHQILDFLKSVNGDKIPIWQPDKWSKNDELIKFREKARPGYSHNRYFFHQLNPNSQEMQNFKFELPEMPHKRERANWWFVILYPGEFQAIHIDPQITEVKNAVRYTMFLEDWIPGHIFVYEDKILTNYTKGDLYEWSDPLIEHGPANIGYLPRYTLQITLFDS